MYQEAKYFKDPFGTIVGIEVLINGNISCVPFDEENTDYQNIMKLVEDGELVIAPAEEPTE